ncbi:Abi family protein [Alcanivorax sp. JB21]|uniref:Abi family protein n=1 Tax=Alcanivorax limicola TaxID=2874102 RepID=UPI001CBFB2AC|nr:Abi family protein [Alcanivorax limicola]MBZ2190100.1 Abi family protein [Alcanivorax limicola]
MDFTKPARTWQEQLELLQARGLIIPDADRAGHYLAHINYYRLTGYWLPFEEDHASHRFRSGASFDDVLNLYIFDREFRLLLLDAIERVEVSLRAQWAYHMAHKHGPHSYLDASLATDQKLHARHLGKLQDEISRSDEIFIQHYCRTYSNPVSPPVRSVSEIMSLGMLSRWITHMVPSDRALLARVYGLDQNVLKGFVRHLAYVRNLCAHHCRVWNRGLTVTMSLPRTKPAALVSSFNPGQQRRIYNTLVMLAALMDVVCPDSQWKKRLGDLLVQHHIDAHAMGFPEGWRNLPVWR